MFLFHFHQIYMLLKANMKGGVGGWGYFGLKNGQLLSDCQIQTKNLIWAVAY